MLYMLNIALILLFLVLAQVPTSQRGIPKNIDWIGFYWYVAHTADIWTALQTQVLDGIAKITQMTTKSIVLIPDALSLFQDEAVLMQIQQFYYATAYAYPNVIGLDFFFMG